MDIIESTGNLPQKYHYDRNGIEVKKTDIGDLIIQNFSTAEIHELDKMINLLRERFERKNELIVSSTKNCDLVNIIDIFRAIIYTTAARSKSTAVEINKNIFYDKIDYNIKKSPGWI